MALVNNPAYTPSFGEKLPGNIFMGQQSVHSSARLALSLDFPSVRGHKWRPQLIVPTNWSRGDINPVTVCTMATFGGMEPSGLAQAFRHFILPVYPNRFTTGRDHVVRATVNWDKKTQWLVAFPLQTQEYLLPRQWIQHSTRTQMQVNRKELLAVTRQCAIKKAVWNQHIRDPVVLSALREDYLAGASSNYQYLPHSTTLHHDGFSSSWQAAQNYNASGPSDQPLASQANPAGASSSTSILSHPYSSAIVGSSEDFVTSPLSQEQISKPDNSFFDGSNTTTGESAEVHPEFASIPRKRKASGPRDAEERPKRKRSKSKSAHMD